MKARRTVLDETGTAALLCVPVVLVTRASLRDAFPLASFGVERLAKMVVVRRQKDALAFLGYLVVVALGPVDRRAHVDLFGDALIHVPVKPRRLLVVITPTSALFWVEEVFNSVDRRAFKKLIFALTPLGIPDVANSTILWQASA